MKGIIFIMIFFLSIKISFSQTLINSNNKLIINHGDLTLYLDNDTSSLLSKHEMSYSNYLNIGKYDRCECWFNDIHKGKYNKNKYVNNNYDLGHLTPSHITSYDSLLNRYSFSYYNEAPQFSSFNRYIWFSLEKMVEDTISKYKIDSIIYTGVIYENKNNYLPNSRIRIPLYYFKILIIGKRSYYWVGLNNKDSIIENITLSDFKRLLKKHKSNIIIKK